MASRPLKIKPYIDWFAPTHNIRVFINIFFDFSLCSGDIITFQFQFLNISSLIIAQLFDVSIKSQQNYFSSYVQAYDTLIIINGPKNSWLIVDKPILGKVLLDLRFSMLMLPSSIFSCQLPLLHLSSDLW